MKLIKFVTWSVGRQMLSGGCTACYRQQHYTTETVNQGTDIPERRYTPRRAVLYIPGNDERKLMKIPSLNVDCAVMDCEDGVAQNKKLDARVNIMKMLDELSFGRTECAVRVNPVNSEHYRHDLEAVCMADNLPQTIMVPKVNHSQDVSKIIESIKNQLHDRKSDNKVAVVLFVESAIGLLNLKHICERAAVLSHQSNVQVDGMVFGSDDFCADIGAKRSTDGSELMYARQKFVTVAKAFRLQAIDMVHIDYKDLDSLKEQSVRGANMGFTGKQVIHPAQIPVVQEAFSPSKEQVEWAVALIQAFEEHQASGKGAFTFRGDMIDMPLLLQAKNIVRLSEAVNTL